MSVNIPANGVPARSKSPTDKPVKCKSVAETKLTDLLIEF